MTVDWSNYINLTPAQQQALWAKYRAIIRKEADDARSSHFARMDAAIRWPNDWRHHVRLTHA